CSFLADSLKPALNGGDVVPLATPAPVFAAGERFNDAREPFSTGLRSAAGAPVPHICLYK
ncbi:jg16813, partial [Pararge aegeria aegeria]